MRSHTDAMKLMIGAVGLLGIECVKGLLRAPLFLDYSNHSTGCQIQIVLKAKGTKSVPAWIGSIWNDAMYEFNDRDKKLGIQTECVFAAPYIERFFEALADSVVQHSAGKAQSELEHKAQQAIEHRAVLDSYRGLLEATNG